MLAEDDGDLRSMLSAALRRDGHRVFEMRDGADLHDDLTLLFLDDYRIPNNLFWCSSPLRLPGVLDHAVAEAGGAPDCR